MTLNFKHQDYTSTMNLPDKVKIVEVGPRDGLQNHSDTISVNNRVDLINKLSDCGLSCIEVGSLVSKKIVPQMVDSELVYQQIIHQPDIQYLMLIANQKGLDRALTAEINSISVFCAATEDFSRHNINCSIEQNLDNIKSICVQAIKRHISVRAYISCVLGCPYQGRVDYQQVAEIAARLYQYGCNEISLSDTIGKGTAGQVQELLQTVDNLVPVNVLAVHFHDTYGQALANIITALQSGIRVIDSSISGIGGCPFAPGASGNVATEDVVYMLNGLGIFTGVDLEQLISSSWYISTILKQRPASKTALAHKPEKVLSI